MESPTRTLPAITRILVPLDGSYLSEQAIPFAQVIGEPESELILLQVAHPGEPIRGLMGRVVVTADEITRVLVGAAEASLTQARLDWLGDRPHVRWLTAVGDAADNILQTAEREHADLIVMASHGYGTIRRWVIGSVADRVVRTSQIPVMVIRPTDGDHVEGSVPAIDRLLVPYDGSALAAQALPFATRLALNLRVPVLLIKVTEIGKSLESAAFYGVPLSPELYDEVIREAQSDDEKLLAEAAEGLREAGVVVYELVANGPVADTIATLAAPTDVIVMTSHGRGGLRRFVLGSVAEKLVREGPVPVVLVPATAVEEVPEHSTSGGSHRVPVEAKGLLI